MNMPISYERLNDGLREGWIVSILPIHGLYVWSPERNGQRFAELFRATWLQLPGHAIKRILRYWKRGYILDELLPMTPTIDLFEFWNGRTDQIWDHGYHAHEILFHSESVHRMPDTLVQTLVARALARVFDAAIHGFDGLCWYDEDEVISGIVTTWGFDNDVLDEWEREHTQDQRG